MVLWNKTQNYVMIMLHYRKVMDQVWEENKQLIGLENQ